MSSQKDRFGFDPLHLRDICNQTVNAREYPLAYIKKYIEKGSIRAMIAMADYLYDNGDVAGSRGWIERAENSIESDDYESMIYLASGYQRSLGVGTYLQRQKKALRLLERVADSGNKIVMKELAQYYEHGLNGARKSARRAKYWVNRASS
jgi:TPR repeat protein